MMKLLLTSGLLVATTVSAFVPAVQRHRPAFTTVAAPPPPTSSRSSSLNAIADDDDANKKVVFITGGSQGLGQAFAYDIAKQGGHKLVINYIAGLEEQAEATVQECKKLGGDAIALVGDGACVCCVFVMP
jgi:UDP-N-acetylglucosamine:LPS N-acetylglucosamine transferase